MARRSGRTVRGRGEAAQSLRRSDGMTNGTIRAATDVGGTFTDLVYFSTDPATGVQEIVTAKSDTTPPDFERGVMNVLAKSGVSLAEIAFLAHGTTARDQRADRAQGREDRADHDRGLPRLARDRARQPAGLLQPPLREAAAVRASLPAPRGAGPAVARRRRARAARPRAGCRRSSTTSAPRASRRSRSACSTPTPTPSHERAVLERVRELWPEVSVGRLAPDHAASGASTSGRARRCSPRTCSRSPSAT